MQVTKPHMPETSACLAELSSLPGHSAGAQRAVLAGSSPRAGPCSLLSAALDSTACFGHRAASAGRAGAGRERGVPGTAEPPLTVTGSCLSEELSDSLMEQWMTLSETIWISHEIRPIFTWYSLLSRPRLSGSF